MMSANKEKNGKSSRKSISIDEKQAIIAMKDEGKRPSEIAAFFNLPRCTISTILAKKDAIKNAKVAKGVSRIFEKGRRGPLMDQMEIALLAWIEQREKNHDITPDYLIMEHAKRLYGELEQQYPSSSSFEFHATKGWFHNFRKRTKIHNVRLLGESGDADVDAAEVCKDEIWNIVQEEGYSMEQIFNVDETALFWKKMPNRTYITEDEMKAPGPKPRKDRLSLLLGANASGTLKLKPLLIYHSKMPHAFSRQKIDVTKLPVTWVSNKSSWMTKGIFENWLVDSFAPEVKEYLLSKNLPLKVLLLLDNAPGHGKEEEIQEKLPSFIRIKFLAPNTTSILQPMDQECIATFKKIYLKLVMKKCYEVCEFSSEVHISLREFWKKHFDILVAVKIIGEAWDAVTQNTLIHAWKKLFPALAQDQDESLEPMPQYHLLEETLVFARHLGFDLTVDELLQYEKEHDTDLSLEDIQGLIAANEEANLPETVKSISSDRLKEVLNQWNNVKSSILTLYPDNSEIKASVQNLDETAINPLREVLKDKQRQSTIFEFFHKASVASTSSTSSLSATASTSSTSSSGY
ncbi:tigger transposable element-derived protein 1-like [Lutzomyia longipalpis]|uniref:tigger transposable element-derived protein 1-like n=1 Tax=Lutzomyia longipalpis TaxID=7200 RepID=UPI00248427CF|nr:tigger transposable element-derived protein 1-like [Lutzomyia longipalpis]